MLFTANETTSVYNQMSNAGSYSVRMKATETATVIQLVNDIWLKGSFKGHVGFIERKRGYLTDYTPPAPVPATDLIRIKTFYEVYGMSLPELKGVQSGKEEVYANIYGLPAAIKMYNTKRIDIAPDRITRKLWLELFAARAPNGMTSETINKRFVGLLKNGVCYTDFAGNVGFNQITTASNFAYSMGSPERKADQLWRPIRCLKVGSYNSMKDQIAKYPKIVTEATISARGYEGREVIPFWHLNGNAVPVPQFCPDDVNFIPEIWVQVATEPLPNLYYPER